MSEANEDSLDPLVGTDLAYRRWLVNEAPQWVRCMIGREDGTVDTSLLLAFRAGRASSSNSPLCNKPT